MGSGVNFYIDIEQLAIVAMVHFQMELSGILHHEVMDSSEVAIHHSYQVRSGVLVREVFFIVEEQEHPPMIASSVNFASALDFDVSAAPERQEILVIGGNSFLARPVFHIFRGNQLAND